MKANYKLSYHYFENSTRIDRVSSCGKYRISTWRGSRKYFVSIRRRHTLGFGFEPIYFDLPTLRSAKKKVESLTEKKEQKPKGLQFCLTYNRCTGGDRDIEITIDGVEVGYLEAEKDGNGDWVYLSPYNEDHISLGRDYPKGCLVSGPIGHGGSCSVDLCTPIATSSKAARTVTGEITYVTFRRISTIEIPAVSEHTGTWG